VASATKTKEANLYEDNEMNRKEEYHVTEYSICAMLLACIPWGGYEYEYEDLITVLGHVRECPRCATRLRYELDFDDRVAKIFSEQSQSVVFEEVRIVAEQENGVVIEAETETGMGGEEQWPRVAAVGSGA